MTAARLGDHRRLAAGVGIEEAGEVRGPSAGRPASPANSTAARRCAPRSPARVPIRRPAAAPPARHGLNPAGMGAHRGSAAPGPTAMKTGQPHLRRIGTARRIEHRQGARSAASRAGCAPQDRREPAQQLRRGEVTMACPFRRRGWPAACAGCLDRSGERSADDGGMHQPRQVTSVVELIHGVATASNARPPICGHGEGQRGLADDVAAEDAHQRGPTRPSWPDHQRCWARHGAESSSRRWWARRSCPGRRRVDERRPASRAGFQPSASTNSMILNGRPP